MTKLTYRGISYIKDDSGRCVTDTPANREILLAKKRFLSRKRIPDPMKSRGVLVGRD